MRKYLLLLILLILFIPTYVFALSDNYKDIVSDITNTKIEDNKINLYLFRGEGCPHCKEEEEWLSTITEKYKDNLNVIDYEVWHNDENANYLSEVRKTLNDSKSVGVPYTVIGDSYFLGYNETIGDQIESKINEYIGNEVKDDIKIPVLGKTNIKEVSIPIVAIILGFIDGFNPCAMWILLLLINICVTTKDKKKMKLIGYTFIFSSALIYLFSMLGLSLVVNLTTVLIIRKIIALLAIILGIYNLYIYIKTRNDTGCHVVDKNKRKSIISKINNIIKQKNVLIAIILTFILASSVNLVELACSVGFPAIFLEILAINEVGLFARFIYLIIYIFFYIVDDLIVLLLSIKAFEVKGISTKYNKYVNLIGGILMIIMGILLIFKPEWIMLNF